MFITDSGQVVYEETSANGYPRNVEKPLTYKLTFFGVTIACHDVIPWGVDMELIVIACMSRNVLMAENTIYLQVLNRKDFTAVAPFTTYTLGADSDFRIFNKLSLL